MDAPPHLVLNVDGNAAPRGAKTRMLRQAGFEVAEAASGTEALRLLAESRPALVLLDGRLPDVGGGDLCRTIKREHPGVLVLQTSASVAAIGDAARGLESGPDAYVAEPIDPDELSAAIRALWRMRSAEIALREETQRLELLNSISRSLTGELDLNALVQAITEAGVRLSGAAFGAFFHNKIDPAGERYTLYTLHGAPRTAFSRFPMPRATPVFHPTFTGERIVRSEDITKDPAYGKVPPHFGMPPGHLPVRSYLAVPVVSRSSEVLGGLFFGHDRPGVFEARHEPLLAGLAGQAAAAIDNARLFQAAQREIEERRRAEEALRVSEEQFRTLAESIPQLAWMTDEKGRFVWFNQRWYEFTGLANVLKAGEAAAVVHPDHVTGVHERFYEAVKAGESWEDTFPMRRHDGAYRWFLSRAHPLRQADGTISRWFGTNTDVTEQRAAETALREGNERLGEEVKARTAERDQIWQVSSELMAVAGFDGWLRSINPAWSRVLGYSEAELLARPFGELIHPDDRAYTAYAVARLRGTGKLDLENRIRRADGSHVLIAWTAVAGADVFYAVGRDVTLERAAAAELAEVNRKLLAQIEQREKAEEQLRQAQKMEAVGQLTGGVAHDFNNLLTVVMGNLETLIRNLDQRESQLPRLERAAENAMRGAQRAAILTQRLLAFARRQPLAPQATDVNRLVAEMSELLRRTLGEQVELRTVLAEALWLTHVDANQLENAVLNLAVNARDAMPDGGTLTIETANVHLDAAYAAGDPDITAGDHVGLFVSDTGSGMSREVLAQAFEPFFTTKDVGSGTGLGLSQVYGFVKQSGGHVKLYSAPGQGSTAKIYLPRLDAGASAAEEAAEAAAAPVGDGSETILLVEDEEDVRAHSASVLRELGYRVIEAPNGAAALRLLDRHPEAKLLFTDVGLPGGMNGGQLADAARARRPDLRVLFTTAYARRGIVHAGRLDPGVEMIPKPFTFADLAAKVRDVLDAAPGP